MNPAWTKLKEGLSEDALCETVVVTGATGETTFTLHKVPALEGWDILEEIREASGGALNVEHAGGIQSAFSALLTALPRPFTKQLRDRMFAHVTFTNRVAKTPLQLSGNEDTAFNLIDAEPSAVYEVFVRALMRSFTGSCVALVERIFSIRDRVTQLSNIER